MNRSQCPHQHDTGHFRDESFQSVICVGTDSEIRTTSRHNTHENHKISNHNFHLGDALHEQHNSGQNRRKAVHTSVYF